jgi:polyisoprenoid-binding protein YceI
VQFDATSGECRVFVRRAGLLSAVGHDVELRATEFVVDLDAGALSVRARIPARAIEVVDAVEDRERQPGKLSAKDKAQINANIANDVLEAARFPVIEFVSTRIEPAPEGYRVHGRLSLHGQSRELTFMAKRRGALLSAEVGIHQPDFGIQPYRALGGTLRVRPDVSVVFELPDPLASTPG